MSGIWQISGDSMEDGRSPRPNLRLLKKKMAANPKPRGPSRPSSRSSASSVTATAALGAPSSRRSSEVGSGIEAEHEEVEHRGSQESIPGALENKMDAEAKVLEDLKFSTKPAVQWTCDECVKQCIPVRGESRCLCGTLNVKTSTSL